MQATAGVTGAISFSGDGLGVGTGGGLVGGSGGGGPYWGAQAALATNTKSEIMAGFDLMDWTVGKCRRWL